MYGHFFLKLQRCRFPAVPFGKQTLVHQNLDIGLRTKITFKEEELMFLVDRSLGVIPIDLKRPSKIGFIIEKMFLLAYFL